MNTILKIPVVTLYFN